MIIIGMMIVFMVAIIFMVVNRNFWQDVAMGRQDHGSAHAECKKHIANVEDKLAESEVQKMFYKKEALRFSKLFDEKIKPEINKSVVELQEWITEEEAEISGS